MKNSTANNSTFTNIDEYIAGFSEDIQKMLLEIRETIHEAAPDAEEKISYQMPTFDLKGNLVHFAAFKNHIGFFPAASGVANFQKELAPYKTSKGTIQFPFAKPVPHALIRKIVLFRVKENMERVAEKRSKKKS